MSLFEVSSGFQGFDAGVCSFYIGSSWVFYDWPFTIGLQLSCLFGQAFVFLRSAPMFTKVGHAVSLTEVGLLKSH